MADRTIDRVNVEYPEGKTQFRGFLVESAHEAGAANRAEASVVTRGGFEVADQLFSPGPTKLCGVDLASCPKGRRVGFTTHGAVAVYQIDDRAIDLERYALAETTSEKHGLLLLTPSAIKHPTDPTFNFAERFLRQLRSIHGLPRHGRIFTLPRPRTGSGRGRADELRRRDRARREIGAGTFGQIRQSANGGGIDTCADALARQFARQKAANHACDLVAFVFEREMARIQQVKFRLRQIL